MQGRCFPAGAEGWILKPSAACVTRAVDARPALTNTKVISLQTVLSDHPLHTEGRPLILDHPARRQQALLAPVCAPDVLEEEHNPIIINSQPSTAAAEHLQGNAGIACLLAGDLGISKDRMQQILLRWPAVEQLDVEYISAALHTLASFFHCKPAVAAAAVAREHRLLHARMPALQQQAAAISEALHTPVHVVLGIAVQSPSILFEQPQEVLASAQAAAEALHVSVQQVAEAAQEEAWLLRAPPSKLASRVQRLGELLGLQPGTKLLHHPRLVCLSSEDVAHKLQHLGSCLQLSPEVVRQLVVKYPRLLEFSQQHYDTHVSTLAEHFPLLLLQHMVLEEPSVLERNAKRIARALQHIQQLLSCSKEAAIEMVARRPCLLTRSQASLRSSYRALSIWQFNAAEKRQLIIAQPLLLRLSGCEVHGRCRWLRNFMLTYPYYHTAIRRVPLQLLGIVIMHLPYAWSRLQYLAESSQEAGTDIMTVVQTKHTDFAKAHRGYRKWLRWKCAQQGCLVPWRCQAYHQQFNGWRKRSPAGSEMKGSAQQLHAAPGHILAGAQGAPGRWPGAWHQEGAQTAHQSPMEAVSHTGPRHVVHVHEARTVVIGPHLLRKPKRVVSIVEPPVPGAPHHEEDSQLNSGTVAQV